MMRQTHGETSFVPATRNANTTTLVVFQKYKAHAKGNFGGKNSVSTVSEYSMVVIACLVTAVFVIVLF